MNKRIQEFAHRCGFTEYRGDDGCDDESLTKFAELIVRECVGISEQHNRNYYTSHGQIIADKIKRHFGVEE